MNSYKSMYIYVLVYKNLIWRIWTMFSVIASNIRIYKFSNPFSYQSVINKSNFKFNKKQVNPYRYNICITF